MLNQLAGFTIDELVKWAVGYLLLLGSVYAIIKGAGLVLAMVVGAVFLVLFQTWAWRSYINRQSTRRQNQIVGDLYTASKRAYYGGLSTLLHVMNHMEGRDFPWPQTRKLLDTHVFENAQTARRALEQLVSYRTIATEDPRHIQEAFVLYYRCYHKAKYWSHTFACVSENLESWPEYQAWLSNDQEFIQTLKTTPKDRAFDKYLLPEINGIGYTVD